MLKAFWEGLEVSKAFWGGLEVSCFLGKACGWLPFGRGLGLVAFWKGLEVLSYVFTPTPWERREGSVITGYAHSGANTQWITQASSPS